MIGRELRFNHERHVVVGVLPAAMRTTWLAFNTDVWLPLRVELRRSDRWLWLFGRLKPGISHTQAQAELDTLAPVLEREFSSNPAEQGRHPLAYHGARIALLGRQLDQTQHGIPVEAMIMWLFAGLIMASVVGIACFNITHLLLVRVLARQREFAIRLSLGAGRGRVVRQFIGETLLITLLGGALGLAVSFWFHDLLQLRHIDARLDWRLYALTAGNGVARNIDCPAACAAILPRQSDGRLEGRRPDRERQAPAPLSQLPGCLRSDDGADPVRDRRVAAARVSQCAQHRPRNATRAPACCRRGPAKRFASRTDRSR